MSATIDNPKDETLFAVVTVEVRVHLERDDGAHWGPPEDYFAAREAEMTNVEFFMDPGIGIIAEYGAADDLDCDNAIINAVRGSLIPAQVEPNDIEIGELRL